MLETVAQITDHGMPTGYPLLAQDAAVGATPPAP